MGAVAFTTRNRSAGPAPVTPSVGEPGANEYRTLRVFTSRQMASRSSPGIRPSSAASIKTAGAAPPTVCRISAAPAGMAARVGEARSREK